MPLVLGCLVGFVAVSCTPLTPILRHPPHIRLPDDVLTQRNDIHRTGAYLTERVLTPSRLASGEFGYLFSRKVEGDIYAQPLYVWGLDIPGKGFHNVVFVATMNNIVYAFDADDPAQSEPLWPPRSLGAPVRIETVQGDTFYTIVHRFVGITSTPVIDTSTATMYVVSKSRVDITIKVPRFCLWCGPPFIETLHVGVPVDRLWALDIRTGQILRSRTIDGSAAGIQFDSSKHLNRPALLLLNNVIYIAFGSLGDWTLPYQGWVFGYRADTFEPAGVFVTTPRNPHKGMGAIWQAGSGLTADERGNIYFMTGNGPFNQEGDRKDLSDSFVKLSTAGHALTLADWFTPYNQHELEACDLDLGSAGPVYLPGTGRLVGAGKEGILYLLDTNDLGKYRSGDPAACLADSRDCDRVLQRFRVAEDQYGESRKTCNVGGPLDPGAAAQGFVEGWNPVVNSYPHVHGSPVVWGPLTLLRAFQLYVWAEEDFLKMYVYVGGRFGEVPARQSNVRAARNSMPGGILSLSADGLTLGSGIVWASRPDDCPQYVNRCADSIKNLVPGILEAFDATTLQRLYRGGGWTFAKFTPPTIANGKVYLATFSNELRVFGLHFLPHAPFGISPRIR